MSAVSAAPARGEAVTGCGTRHAPRKRSTREFPLATGLWPALRGAAVLTARPGGSKMLRAQMAYKKAVHKRSSLCFRDVGITVLRACESF